MHIGPGLLAGDRVDLDVQIGPGARAVIVAQSATKVHRMPTEAFAEQRVRIHVAAGGSLEVHPGLVIPFAGSALRQTVDVDLAPGARFAWLERWVTGRDEGDAVEGGHGFRTLSSRFSLRVDGVLRYADALELDGTEGSPFGILDGRRCLATGVFVGGGALPATSGHEGLAVGCFDADIAGHYVRCLGDDALAVRRATESVGAEWRANSGHAPLALHRYGS